MKDVYVVMYEDGSWGSHGNYILAIYDNEEQALELVYRVRIEKNNFEGLSGSSCSVIPWTVNQEFDISELDYYR